jgi:putative mRNA 3-end processing factor
MAGARRHDALLITWRDGIHIHGTPIWCDARRARDVCFVSCAHAISSARHGQLIATAPTLALLDAQAYGSQLSVPYGRPFSLGTVRLELIRSGHGLGSASLVADVGDRRVLYAGAVNLRGGGLGGAADIRQCDTLAAFASYGDPRFRFPALDEVIPRVMDFVKEVTCAGGVAVLLVSSASKAMDVASRLGDLLAGPSGLSGLSGSAVSTSAQPAFFAHRGYADAAQRLRPAHPTLSRLRRWPGKPPGGHVLLWPVERRDALPGPLPASSRVALVSGDALDPEILAALAVDTAFPWSNQADCEELVHYIDTSGATHVFLTGRFAEPLARRLDGPRRLVHALGPPRQMDLF